MRSSQNGGFQPTNFQMAQQQLGQQPFPQSNQMVTSMPDNRFLREALANQQAANMISQTPTAQQQQQNMVNFSNFKPNQQQQQQPSIQFQQQQQNFIQQMLQQRMKQQQQMNGGQMTPQQQPQTQNSSGQPSFANGVQMQLNGNGQMSLRSSLQQQNFQPSQGLPPLSQQTSYSSQVQTQQTSSNDNFKVVIRVRPPLPREKTAGCEFQSITNVTQDNKSCAIMEYLGAEVSEHERQKDIEQNPHLCVWQNFTFDYVYDENSTQEFVYENTAKQAVWSVLEGYNATILAYGQTGTGKTYTMEGFKYSAGDPQRGIVPRSMEEIFRFIQMQSSQNTTFMVRASYLQIYNEVISDLLKIDRTSLQIREDKKKGVFVEGLSEWAVRSPNEIYSLMQKGALSRATATTKMNDLSSRSHAVFIIIVEQMTCLDDGSIDDDAPKQIKVGKLNLVDLAGSERVRVTGATGKRLEESKKINQSLSCLGNVIAALTDQKPRSHIPYRDSKLTRLLEDSLGGNCKTTMMAMISPSSDAFGESLSTLKFATRAKRIKNEAKINEDVDQRALLRKYEIELRRLKQELDDKNKTQVGVGGNVTQLEEEKRKAEQDKEAAINALEIRHKEYLQEREEKRRLEEKIKMMNSQMLIGGKKIEDTPQFRSALEEKQRIIRQEYELKLQDIERERNLIEEDKAQVDRYKQLLLKQRDIMIALTSRLNERDETIIQLQEELDAYDRIHRETEQVIDVKQMRIGQLEDFIRDQCGQEPPSYQYEDQPFAAQGIYQHQRQSSLSMNYQQMNNNERKYPALGEEGQNVLLTADEKIQEMNQVLEEQSYENEMLKMQLQQIGSDKITFVREKIDDLVAKEVQLKLNGYQAQSQQQEREMQVKSKQQSFNNELIDEEINQLKGQFEIAQQEKQAYFMISSDIQNLVVSALQDIGSAPNDPQRVIQSSQKLNEVNKLIASLQKHLSQQQQIPNGGQKLFHQPRLSNGQNTSQTSAQSNLENQFPLQQQQQQRTTLKSGSQQASPQNQNLQNSGQNLPFNPNAFNQRMGQGNPTGNTPRGSSQQQNSFSQQQQQPFLPPKHVTQLSNGGSQQQMAVNEKQNFNKEQVAMNVTEMLRQRQESKKNY